MTETTLGQALQQALHDAMVDDERVVILGEDVGRCGGVFRVTEGLWQKFGDERVINTPLSENLIGGMAAGMAMRGLIPVAEFQFMGFIYPAFQQIVSHIARMHNRTRGRLSCPLVLRAPYGGGIHAPEHHSESLEASFAHIPGLRVVAPSCAQSGYHLLRAAIEHPDPILFLEPKRSYRSKSLLNTDPSQAIAIDKARILRPGSDVTLIAWGAMIPLALEAADRSADCGINVEVIDVATLSPIDMTTIADSVTKTGRVVITHEAPLSGGLGAEIAAYLAEHQLDILQAPIIRVTGYDTIMPYYRLEKAYLPSVERILDGLERALSSS